MKYTKTELEILRKGGRAALDAYHSAQRKQVPAAAPRTIEDKRHRKPKYKSIPTD